MISASQRTQGNKGRKGISLVNTLKKWLVMLEEIPSEYKRQSPVEILLLFEYPGGGVLHYGVRLGCAPVLGSFWPEDSGIGIYFYWKISVIGVYFHLEFSGIGGLLCQTLEWYSNFYQNVSFF